MGKVEYDVFVDGEKVGTASRDQTGFEKWLDDAVSESQAREAKANLTIAACERLSIYGSLRPLTEREIKEQIRERKRQDPKRIKTSIILLFFVGFLGVHRFFLGDKVIGIYYILLFAARFFIPDHSLYIPILAVSLIIDLISLIGNWLENTKIPERKMIWTSIILLFPVGFLGLHRFFLGDKGIGIYYIILFAARFFILYDDSVYMLILVVSLIIDLISLIRRLKRAKN